MMIGKRCRARVRAACLALTLLGVGGLGLLVVREAQAGPRTVRDAQAPPHFAGVHRARLLGSVIHRDQRTRRAIAHSAGQSLPALPHERWRLLLTKSRYRLDVFDGLQRVKVYPVAFGGSPKGPKEKMGDQRTPEGRYVLVPHHPSPSFGPSFYVLYPGVEDTEHAYRRGLIDKLAWREILVALEERQPPPHWTDLGGLILIHGTKERRRLGLTRRNWTLGCIAMENQHLDELLAVFQPEDRPVIHIRP